MFEKFTDRARRVMMLAECEAKRLNHEYIGGAHILLGLAGERFGVGAAALKGQGADLEKLRGEFERIVPALPCTRKLGALPLSPSAECAMAAAWQECQALGHNYVGTEHLLLGLLCENRESKGLGWGINPVVSELFENAGLTVSGVRQEVLNILGHA